jgi:hypothetical protein
LKARFKGFSGPIGSGKSQALCHEALRLTYLNPGRLGLIGAPTFPMLRDATQAALLAVLERNRIPFEWNKAENWLEIKETGSRILFRSLEDFERLRGSNLAWFGVDELTYTSEEAWQRLEGRLRDLEAKHLCGFGVWTPKGLDWVYERFLAKPPEGYECVIAKAKENRFLLDRVPDYYDRLKASYESRFYQQEALGQYLEASAGRVYGTFQRKLNVMPLERDPNRELLWALDFNVNPMSSVVAQKDGSRVRVLDEIVLGDSTTRDACIVFLERYSEHSAGVTVYADASGMNRQTTGSSDLEIVKGTLAGTFRHRLRMKIPTRNPSVRDRITLMNSMLEAASGAVRLVVDGRCEELIKDFEQVRYKEGTTVMDKERDWRRTHLTDALGYLLWQEHQAMQTVGERNHPLPGMF